MVKCNLSAITDRKGVWMEMLSSLDDLAGKVSPGSGKDSPQQLFDSQAAAAKLRHLNHIVHPYSRQDAANHAAKEKWVSSHYPKIFLILVSLFFFFFQPLFVILIQKLLRRLILGQLKFLVEVLTLSILLPSGSERDNNLKVKFIQRLSFRLLPLSSALLLKWQRERGRRDTHNIYNCNKRLCR